MITVKTKIRVYKGLIGVCKIDLSEVDESTIVQNAKEDFTKSEILFSL